MLWDYIENSLRLNKTSTMKYNQKIISFEELLNKINIFSSKLNEQKYAIKCNNPINESIAILACLKTQKTAVILSDKYGEIHCNKIIEKTKISFIITDSSIEKINEERYEEPILEDVAFIMCTSGTTGTPKGAMITQKNLITNLNDIGTYFDVSRNDKILIARPLYHCAVLTGEFLYAVLKGVSICFYNGEFNPIRIIKTINNEKISVFCGTPTMLFYICKIANKLKLNIPIYSVVTSGENMNLLVAQTIRKTLPNARVYNVYGLTEASPRVAFLRPELFDKYPNCVGEVLPSLDYMVENEELLLKGNSIMKGYYEDDELNNSVFINGFLKTGDLVEINALGLISVKCRKDNLIIRAGINIYPNEIENELLKIKEIEDILVYGEMDKNVGQKIHIKIVSKTLTREEIFNICKKKLSLYQYPDYIDIVEKLNKNASGKKVR